ncbi:MAG: helix-turn-helix transcriptional regulator, partial [Deltaproteobacteria bacterium]|nr:helix-turn-helix transcriptional regulator [Deltaproteobacteria bacterium]
MPISCVVREARRRAGLTQAQLAERAGVPKSTVGRIESGARVPSTKMVERLVRAAGLEVSVSLSEPDAGTDSMFERTLRRSPAERLADATRVARFVLRGRREVAAAADRDFDPEAMLSALANRGVRFVLIGGMAAVLHGDVGVTVDIDVVPERSDENLERLARALRDLGARIRTEGEPEGLQFDCSAEFFK